MATLTLEQRPEGWNPVAASYDAVFAPFSSRLAEDALRLAGVREGDRVLDVAAGTGALSLAAARRGADVLATDFSPGMLSRLAANAERMGLAVRTEVQDGQALAVAEGSFDAAFSVLGLIFFPDREAGLRGLHRAVRPGGRVGVVSWSSLDRLEIMRVVMGALEAAVPDLPAPAGPPPWLALADPAVLESEMRSAGFRQVDVSTVSNVLPFADPESFFDQLPGLSPALAFVFENLSAEGRAAFRDRFTASVRADQGPGPYGLGAEAHIAIGTR